MKSEAKTAIQTGSMDMPDPVNSAEKLKEQLKNKGNWNESNTVEAAVSAANELERETTRATIASVLGEVGQERTKNEIEATEQTVAEPKNSQNLHNQWMLHKTSSRSLLPKTHKLSQCWVNLALTDCKHGTMPSKLT